MPDRNAMTVLQDDDPTRPYVGMGAGERRRAKLSRELRKKEYQGTRLDDYFSGFLGDDAGGSVLDPDRENRVAMNELGRLTGIVGDTVEAPLAALRHGGKYVLDAIKRAARTKAAVGEGVKIGSKVADDALASALKTNVGVTKEANVLDKLRETATPPKVDVEVVPPAAPVTPREVQAPRKSEQASRYQSGEKKGIYRGTEGFLVGDTPGITKGQLGKIRKDYIADAQAGAPYSKYWYDDTSKVIYDLTGGEIPKADDLAHALSVTSSSTPVGSNAMYGFKAWNQRATGEPIWTGKYPTRMSDDIARGWSGEDVMRGLKRDPYKEGLSVHWRPNPGLRPTNDIHQMRAYGIRDPKSGKPWSKGVGEAGHRFIDTQTAFSRNKLNQIAREAGEPEDWTDYRVQAAAWAPQRVKTGQAESLEDAAKHYGDFVDDYSAHVTREWVPGATTGHLPEMLRDDALKAKYSRMMEEVMQGHEGNDAMANAMGLLSSPTMTNRGVYEDVVSPGYISRIPVGKSTGSHAIDPASDAGVRALAGAHGLVGLQDQSAYNFLTGKASNRDVGGFRLERSLPNDVGPEVRGPFSDADLARLQARLPEGVDIPQRDPRGARVLHFGDPYGDEAASLGYAARLGGGLDETQADALVRESFKPEDTARRKLVDQLRKTAREFRAELVPHESSTALFPTKPGSYDKPDTWSAKPFVEAVEGGGPGMEAGFNEFMREAAPQLLSKTEAIAKEHGLTQAPFFRPMMEALGTGGLPALKELIRQGIVPVAVLGLIGGIWAGGGGDEPS